MIVMKHIATALLSGAIMMCAASCSSDKKTEDNAQQPAGTSDPNGLPVYDIPFSATSTLGKTDKKVLVLSASPRRGGNTDLLCDEFVRGAREAGGDVEKIFLDDYKIDFFHEEHSEAPDTIVTPGDQAPMIIQKMVDADIIVLSSPVYYMNIDGQLKTLMDRCYRNAGMKGKEFYYITACADSDPATAETAIFAFRGFVVCLPQPTERGSVKAIGLGRKGEVDGSAYLSEAYELGKTI